MRSADRYLATTLATAAVVIGIVAFLGIISFNNQKKQDFTKNQRHSLAEQSTKVVASLEQPVRFTLFIKDGDPKKFLIQRMLERYAYHSDDFTFELIDPERSPSRTQGYNLDQYGVPVGFFERDDDTRESVTGFQALDTLQEGNTLRVSAALEELLTNALIKATRGQSKTVYVLTGHGEAALEGEGRRTLLKARAALEDKSYAVKPLPLLGQSRIPKDADVLLILGPIKELDPSELQAIRRYLDSGGRALVCIDPQTSVGLAAAVAQYGITLGNDVVVDFNVLNQLMGGDPLVPIAGGYEEHPITRPLGQTATYFPQARSVSVNASGMDYSTVALVMTSPDSLSKTNMLELQEGLSTGQMVLSESDLRGPITLAAVSEWAGKAAVDGEADEAAPETEASDADTDAEEPDVVAVQNEPQQGRLVVMGDSDFLTDQHFEAMGNSDLFLNAVNWLAQEEDLIAIRPKTLDNQHFVLSAAEAWVTFLVPIVVLPGFVLLFGGAVWYRRSQTG